MGKLSGVATSGYGSLSARQAVQRLLTQVGVYGTGNALQRLGAFVLLPIYIWRLSPEEYGLLALSSILPAILPPVFSLGLSNAITRYYHEWLRQGLAARNLGIIWVISTGSMLCATVLIDQIGEALLSHLLTQVPFDPYLRLGLWWAFFTGLSACPLTLLRIRELSKSFVTVSLLSFLLGTGLTMWAILSGWGVKGILLMQVISSASIGLLLTGWYLRQASVRPHGPSLVCAVRFSLPLVPSAMFEVVASRADRFFLDKWVPLQEIGLYALANQVGQGVKFFYDSVKPAWFPFYIRVSGERADAQAFLGRVVTLYVSVLCMIALIVLLFAPDVISWIGENGRYAGALPLLPVLVGCYFLQGIAPIGTAAVLVAERTIWQPLIQLAQLVAVIAANIVLTQRFGIFGAAWSLMVTYGLLAGLYVTVGQQLYPLVFDWGRLVWLLNGGLLVVAVVVIYPSVGIAVKSLLLLSFMICAWALIMREGGLVGGLATEGSTQVSPKA